MNTQRIIEQAGCEFVAQRGDSVDFKDPESGDVLRLYARAVRSTEDIELAIKSHRENIRQFEPWMPESRP